MTELFSVMLLAWPNAEMFKGGVAKLGPTIELWTACLPEVDFWTGRQAVVRLCRTSPFPPSIAEFKRQAEAVDRDFSFRRLVGVVGVLGDKDARGILAALEPVLDEVVITQNTSPRAVDVEVLAEYARDAFGEERVHVAVNLPGAVELAVQLAEDDGGFGDTQVSGAGVLVTGSVVTAGEARALFGKDPA